jgi:hypothetical protein
VTTPEEKGADKGFEGQLNEKGREERSPLQGRYGRYRYSRDFPLLFWR